MVTAPKSNKSSEPEFYAMCETLHEPWTGPDRTTYDAAKSDADDHDQQVHNGEPTASVIGP